MITWFGTIVCDICNIDGTKSNRSRWDVPTNITEDNYMNRIIPADKPYMAEDEDYLDRVVVRRVARRRAKEYG